MLLCFQARRFRWKAHSRTLDGEEQVELFGEVEEALVAFVQAEARDEEEERRGPLFRRALKHLKWLAGKRELRTVVLHSFAHLGGESAAPEFTRDLFRELAARLERAGYRVRATPFGWSCEWEISVHGEGIAKVWKEV